MKFKKIAIVGITIAITISAGYSLAVFTDTPGLSNLRNLWIETAMTSGHHQWLATSFIPKSVIDKVMNQKTDNANVVGVTQLNEQSNQETLMSSDNEAADSTDILGQRNLGTVDKFGNKILVNDKEQGIVITEIKTMTYSGKLIMIDDPSRVFVEQTNQKGVQGELILDYLKDYDAVAGINANGFDDPDGNGLGGDILGCSLSGGVEWGVASEQSSVTIGLDENNRLVVGHIDSWNKYNLRDAAQFAPVLIANGKIITEGSAGWGIQPRTIVGQRADGVIMFMVIDGRQPDHSIGITLGDCADILYKYDVVNAAACDGGSSSVMAYNGKIINQPSTPMITGRYLPNALLVKRKQSSQDTKLVFTGTEN